MQDGTFQSPGHPEVTDPLRGNVLSAECPTRRVLDRVADKWSVLALLLLSDQPMRFNVLKRTIQGVSQKMLSQTLRGLERDGLVSRTVEPTVPVSVTYAVTPLGKSLVAALLPMIEWAETRITDVSHAQHVYDLRA